jgi:WD40 repeat protein
MCIDFIGNNRIISGGTDWSLIVWDINSKEIVCTLEDHEEGVTAVAVLGDGNIASGSMDQTIKIWE